MTASLPQVRLQPQRHKRVASGHPWIYSNEIVMDGAAKALPPGAQVAFYGHDGRLIGRGSFHPGTLIAGRLFTRGALECVDEAWLVRVVERALARRAALYDEPYYRLIHAEADGLPGLIVDRFGDILSVQVNTAGMQALWPMVEAALQRVLNPAGMALHNDSPARALEGLERAQTVTGSVPPRVAVRENGLSFLADLCGGQKTGWYYDQRDNHALMARYARGKSMLDVYCHAGGFGLAAARAGATRMVGIDSSEPALDLARQAAEQNGLAALCSFVRADAFEELERLAADRQSFDLVIADPPPFVRSRKDIASGARGYRKLTRLAASVTAREGLLLVASCSHNMELSLLTEQVAHGLRDAGRDGQILHTVFAAPDHPVHPHLPESAYLKGLVVRVA